MNHSVLAIATAALTAGGCVWYLPAIADLQAGADRPRSTRTAAAACVLGWATLALAGGLLLALGDWRPAAQLALAGLGGGVALWLRALRERRVEQREADERWIALDAGPAPRPPRSGRSSAVGLAGWLVVGAAVASLGAAAVLLSGGGTAGTRAALAAGSGVGVALLFLVMGLRSVRR